MTLRTYRGKWYITDGDQTVTYNSSAEARQYIFNHYKKEKNI